MKVTIEIQILQLLISQELNIFIEFKIRDCGDIFHRLEDHKSPQSKRNIVGLKSRLLHIDVGFVQDVLRKHVGNTQSIK